ncbi:hypothetical protein BCEN4_570031 [Burkholderia cenocepacia]|nr:hypothetical protein BCEN4_570031 [Burkholderia cenocepacia]
MATAGAALYARGAREIRGARPTGEPGGGHGLKQGPNACDPDKRGRRERAKRASPLLL